MGGEKIFWLIRGGGREEGGWPLFILRGVGEGHRFSAELRECHRACVQKARTAGACSGLWGSGEGRRVIGFGGGMCACAAVWRGGGVDVELERDCTRKRSCGWVRS
jgi:hypothetical protein